MDIRYPGPIFVNSILRKKTPRPPLFLFEYYALVSDVWKVVSVKDRGFNVASRCRVPGGTETSPPFVKR